MWPMLCYLTLILVGNSLRILNTHIYQFLSFILNFTFSHISTTQFQGTQYAIASRRGD